MTRNRIVPHEEWLKARLELLSAEKAYTRQRDTLTRQRMMMPWERVVKSHIFGGPSGLLSLPDLFDGRSQLIIHHLMFAPEWEEACKSCSFWADSYQGIAVHLANRDVTLAAVSRAPFSKLVSYKQRMGWTVPWVSSFGSDFSYDYQASFTPEEVAARKAYHNYRMREVRLSDDVAFSVFARDAAGEVFHTYSCYQRGVESLNNAYDFLHLVSKGRDEDAFSFPMTWVRRRDQY